MTCACVRSCFGRVPLFAALRTAALQAPLCMGFSRQESWSGVPCPPPGDLPDPGTEPSSLLSPALAGGFFTTGATWEAPDPMTHGLKVTHFRSKGPKKIKLKIEKIFQVNSNQRENYGDYINIR